MMRKGIAISIRYNVFNGSSGAMQPKTRRNQHTRPITCTRQTLWRCGFHITGSLNLWWRNLLTRIHTAHAFCLRVENHVFSVSYIAHWTTRGHVWFATNRRFESMLDYAAHLRHHLK